MWQSSNPVLSKDDKFSEFYGAMEGKEKSTVITLQGVVNKTAILTLVAVIAGTGGYKYFMLHPDMLWIGCIATLVLTLGIYFVIFGDPRKATYLAPVYAIVEGAFLGGFTAIAESMLASRGLSAAGGVALQAFVITISVLLAMLVLYSTRVIKPNGTFMSIMAVAACGIGIMYLISFMLSMFAGIQLPFISLGSTMATGMSGYIGLGLNLFILGIASFMLIFDFKLIEDKVNAGAPRYMEWFCGFALIVSLAWIYFEAVKLVLRLSSLFGRD